MASSQPAPLAVAPPSFAGFGRRLAAFVIDAVLACCPMVVFAITFRILHALHVWTVRNEGFDPVETWHAMAVPAKLAILLDYVILMGPIYLAVFESSSWQASVGKRLLGIYVTDDQGRRIGIARAFGRWIAKVVLNWFMLLLVSVVTIVATRRKQALHDFVAGTLVVCGRPQPGGSLETWRILAAFVIPYLWLLATFLAIL